MPITKFKRGDYARLKIQGRQRPRSDLPEKIFALRWFTKLPAYLVSMSTLLFTDNMDAGTITGTVRAQGKPGADADLQGGKYDSRQFKFVERVNYEQMRDFVVYIVGPVDTKMKLPAEPAQV